MAVSAAYRTSMAEFAGMTNLAVWSSRTTDIDASAEVALREVIDGLRERNIELHIARAAVELRERLDDVELTNAIGAGRTEAEWRVEKPTEVVRPDAIDTPELHHP